MKKLALAAMLSALAIGARRGAGHDQLAASGDQPRDGRPDERGHHRVQGAHPEANFELQFLENEAFKSKLTTLLQSDDAPDIFHSWGGGVFDEQAKAGVLRAIDDVLTQEAKDAVGPAGVAAFTAGRQASTAIARNVSEVVFWYNKELFAQAGVDPASLSTWDGFLAGVKKLKDAGITPIALGGKDKWPAHFWWSYLVVRSPVRMASTPPRPARVTALPAQTSSTPAR